MRKSTVFAAALIATQYDDADGEDNQSPQRPQKVAKTVCCSQACCNCNDMVDANREGAESAFSGATSLPACDGGGGSSKDDAVDADKEWVEKLRASCMRVGQLYLSCIIF